MNDISGIVKLLAEVAKRRCEKADENRKNGIPDPLNDLVDATKDGILSDILKRKLKKKKK
jgi:hypothetical protein